jgi:hypothetical protein
MGVDIIAAIDRKGADTARIAETVIGSPKLIPRLLEALEDRKARVKYGAEKVLRAVSERRPDLLYPYFADFVRLLDVENSFIKWGVIRTVANLSAADTDNRIASVFRKFFAPLTGPDMVTAVTIIGGGAIMARAKPAMTNRIVKEILKVETAAYELHGVPSPECRNVACGQAIDALDTLCEGIARKKPVIDFVRRQLRSTRPAVRRKAEAFLSKHSL